MKRVRAFHIELEIGSVGSQGEGKTGVPGEKPPGARERKGENQQQTQPRGSKQGHIGGRRVLSPLRHPLLSGKESKQAMSVYGSYS